MYYKNNLIPKTKKQKSSKQNIALISSYLALLSGCTSILIGGLFFDLDVNGDKFISEGEWEANYSQREDSSSVSKEEHMNEFFGMDRNGDNKVSKNELKRFFDEVAY